MDISKNKALDSLKNRIKVMGFETINSFKKGKESIKRGIVLTSIAALLVSSMTGCFYVSRRTNSIFGNKKELYSDSEDDKNISTVVEDKDEENENFYSSTGADLNIGLSYNSYLYQSTSTSLSTPITGDLFGYSQSNRTDNADRRLAEGDYSSLEVNLNRTSYDGFVKWVDNRDVIYKYADLYEVDYALTAVKAYTGIVNSQKTSHRDLITAIDVIPTLEQIENVIIKNNRHFLANNKGYGDIGNNNIYMAAEIIHSFIIKYHDYLDKETLTKIYCMLNDIIIVSINSMDFTVNDLMKPYNARTTDEGVIMLDFDNISRIRGDNTLERTLSHEVAHLFQRICPDEKIEGFSQIGSSQYIEDFEETNHVNSLHWQWLYEAAAEQMSMDNAGAKTPLVYKNMVGYLNTLDIITLIRPGYEENSIAISQLSNNPSKIFEVFGAVTEEEKKEVIYMLYSICFIQNNREDFVSSYENVYGLMSDEDTIKNEMRQSIVKTMIKYFYKNLAERVVNTDVSLQDVFYLINVFEECINRHIGYDEADRYEMNKDVITYYIEVQDEFFRMLVNNNENLTYDELLNLFGTYALVIKTDVGYQRNYEFSWLTTGEKEYIGDVLTRNIAYFTTNIRNMDFNNLTK